MSELDGPRSYFSRLDIIIVPNDTVENRRERITHELRRRLINLAIAALLATCWPAASRADQIFGVTLLDNQLISIDPTTGNGTLIGPLSSHMNPFGLADVNGSFYTFDSNADVITKLDPATGATLAKYNIGVGPVLGQGGLAFQSSTVGFLTSALDPTTLNPVNNLYRFDIASGSSSLIAQTTDTLEAISFGPGGVLYAMGKLDGTLYTVNPTTGLSHLLATSASRSVVRPAA